MRKFQRGDHVEKVSGSKWRGKVVGEYSTSLTPEGYAVESDTEHGSVQIYPAKALRATTDAVQDMANDEIARLREILTKFIQWADLVDDAQFLNGEHAEQRASDRDGWDDLRDIVADARTVITRSRKRADHGLNKIGMAAQKNKRLGL